MLASGLGIGTINVPAGAILAPLASVTNAPFRRICLEHGCALAVTEMVSSEAVVRDGRKSLARMRRAEGEKHLAVQLFGASPGHDGARRSLCGGAGGS